MPKVRNPALYKALYSAFGGKVRVQAAGMAFRYSAQHRGDGHIKVKKIDGGEEYCVCCPFCKDTKFRLNVNHMFGQRLKCGVKMDNLAHCWNEDCNVIPKIKEIVESAGANKVVVSTEVDSVSAEEMAKLSYENYLRLTNTVFVNELPEDHPAVRYLQRRFFDVDHLSKRYGVQYMGKCKHRYAKKRIIIPIFCEVDGKMQIIGWQARRIPGHTLSKKPKYWTSPGYRKGHYLYDFQAARRCDSLVLVEGPTDSMRVGRPAVALLGKDITSGQLSLIYSTYRDKDGPIILIGDPGYQDSWETNLEKLQEIFRYDDPERVGLIMLEKDPGDTSTSLLWKSIAYKAGEMGYGGKITIRG